MSCFQPPSKVFCCAKPKHTLLSRAVLKRQQSAASGALDSANVTPAAAQTVDVPADVVHIAADAPFDAVAAEENVTDETGTMPEVFAPEVQSVIDAPCDAGSAKENVINATGTQSEGSVREANPLAQEVSDIKPEVPTLPKPNRLRPSSQSVAIGAKNTASGRKELATNMAACAKNTDSGAKVNGKEVFGCAHGTASGTEQPFKYATAPTVAKSSRPVTPAHRSRRLVAQYGAQTPNGAVTL